MEKWIDNMVTQEVLSEASSYWGLNVTKLKSLGDFENYVYEAGDADDNKIIRLTHSSHRDKGQISGEIEWLEFLLEKGMSVTKPHLSESGELFHAVTLKDGSELFVCVFDKAPGEFASKLEWTPEFIRSWGKEIGRMQRFTLDYSPSSSSLKRISWEEDDLTSNYRGYLGPEDGWLPEIYDEYVDFFKSLPVSGDNFGLIHRDLHHGNFLVDNGRFTFFDFDDAAYQFNIFDPVISYFHAVGHPLAKEDITAFSDLFLVNLLKGYREEFHLDPSDLDLVEPILFMRRMEIFTVFRKKAGYEDLEENLQKLMDRMTQAITERKPYTEYDFSRLRQFL